MPISCVPISCAYIVCLHSAADLVCPYSAEAVPFVRDLCHAHTHDIHDTHATHTPHTPHAPHACHAHATRTPHTPHAHRTRHVLYAQETAKLANILFTERKLDTMWMRAVKTAIGLAFLCCQCGGQAASEKGASRPAESRGVSIAVCVTSLFSQLLDALIATVQALTDLRSWRRWLKAHVIVATVRMLCVTNLLVAWGYSRADYDELPVPFAHAETVLAFNVLLQWLSKLQVARMAPMARIARVARMARMARMARIARMARMARIVRIARIWRGHISWAVGAHQDRVGSHIGRIYVADPTHTCRTPHARSLFALLCTSHVLPPCATPHRCSTSGQPQARLPTWLDR